MRQRAQKYGDSIFLMVCILLASVGFGHAQLATTQIAYLLSLDEVGWRSCRVSLTIENIQQDHLIFSLTDRIPGNYTRIDATTRIQNLKMEGAQNALLPFEQLTPNRWLVDTQNQAVVRVTYDVKMQESEIPAHKLDARGALIHSGLVFLFPENYPYLPVYIRLMVPENWKVATSLRPTSYLNEFLARNFDELMNAPLLIGDFQDFYFQHEEKTINVVINQFRNQPIDRFLGTLRKIVRTQALIFNGLPFENFLFLCEFLPATQLPQATGFRDACILLCPADAISDELNAFAPLVAREFFRIWNGKRIRPATAQIGKTTFLPQTNLLWFCAGCTHYYGDLTMVRGKIWDEVEFLHQIGLRIARLKENPFNQKMTVTAASLAEWETDNPALTAFYENRGYLLALLLDLKIRQTTHNENSLDDVFQLLNWWFAKDELPYTQPDLLRAINAVSQSDFSRFFARYIDGVKELPLDELLQLVGLNAQVSRKTVADWGEWPRLNRKNQVLKIDEKSLLSQAGLEKGAQIVAIDTIKTSSPEAFFETAGRQKENSEITLQIQRNNTPATLRVKIGQKTQFSCILANLPEPNSNQIQNRQLWLQNAPGATNF
jgi:predicted metalloprotease with PDZ domain